MNRVTQLNDNDRERLKSKSPAVLPDNPSGRGWSASQIKAKFYEGLMLLFEWQRRTQSETNDLLNLIEEEATQAVVETVNRIINGDITVKKAYQDDYGNPIRHTYSTKKELDDLLKSLKAGEQAVLKYIGEDGSQKEINSIERNLSKLIVQLTAGEMTVNKAINNADGENIIETYVRNSRIADSKTSVDTTQIATLAITKELINDLSERLINGSTETLDTLQELATAIGNNPNFATTITDLIGKKLSIEDAVQTYLTKTTAAETYSTKNEVRDVATRLDNFMNVWEEIPKINALGIGRFSITYEDWIGELGNGRYSLSLID